MLLSVGFLTLIERKLIGVIQNRISVNKNFIVGLSQPIIDGVKLFIKQIFINYQRILILYYLGPLWMFLVCIEFWEVIDFDKRDRITLRILLLICLLRCNIYSPLVSSVTSNNKYGFFRRIRIVIITINIEIILSVVIYFIYLSTVSREILVSSMFTNIIVSLVWVFIIIIESIRGCFDMGESERELVRAFNIEYRANLFVLIFLSEYSTILFLSIMTRVLFFGGSLLILFFVVMFLILIRCVFVRLKIDRIITLRWVKLLPLVIYVFLIYI
jgi:NADH:ubiquinone oxidoreductase subunit H